MEAAYQNIENELKKLYRDEKERIASLAGTYLGDMDNPVFGDGNFRARLMFIGEAPGSDEALIGKPFVGKAGMQLDGMLKAAQIDRSEVFITNVVKYRPTKPTSRRMSNRTPSAREIREGLELLRREIALVRPSMIASLGNTPLAAMSLIAGIDVMKIGDVHAAPTVIEIGGLSAILFPLYHPASTIYNRELTQVLQDDLVSLGKLYTQMRMKI